MDRDPDIVWVAAKQRSSQIRRVAGKSVRVVLGNKTFVGGVPPGSFTPGRVGVQGIAPGTTRIELHDRVFDAVVCGVEATGATGKPVDRATSHASLSRTLPSALFPSGDGVDLDALTWTLVCPKGAMPRNVGFESTRPDGDALDSIESAALLMTACPASVGPGFECATTEPIRATVDLVDRRHPSISSRSLRAEVGGRIALRARDKKAASIRVGGPRETARGPVDRYRGKLRFHVVRTAPSGHAAVGGRDVGARNLIREEARTASMLWGQCGIHFGPDAGIEVEVVDPPPRYLIAVGCDLGLPATGGTIAFGIGEREIRVPTRAGDSPVAVAHAVAEAVRALGFAPTVSDNARILPGAQRTADVLLRKADGELVEAHPLVSEPLSSDASLAVCLGGVNLGDGLSHFEDLDAAAGTVEERTLVRAYQDDDPSTIEVFIVPSFSKTGRIGESFIDADGSGIQNAVIIDRAGIRSGARSYALAHEIGHVLLDLPGHPDDFGVDRPWELMDADAADSTIFGPRRLSVEDCERALVQSGPNAAVQLLTPWPLTKKAATKAANRRPERSDSASFTPASVGSSAPSQ